MQILLGDVGRKIGQVQISRILFLLFDDYLRHLSLDALKLQGFDGCFGCRWRFEIHEAVALALVSVLVQDGFRRDDGSEPAPAILATEFLQILIGGVGREAADVQVSTRQLITADTACSRRGRATRWTGIHSATTASSSSAGSSM